MPDAGSDGPATIRTRASRDAEPRLGSRRRPDRPRRVPTSRAST